MNDESKFDFSEEERQEQQQIDKDKSVEEKKTRLGKMQRVYLRV